MPRRPKPLLFRYIRDELPQGRTDEYLNQGMVSLEVITVLYPTKFVDWGEVAEWSRRLARRIESSGWSPEVIVAVGRGGYVVSRLLCDYLRVEDLVSLQVRWVETVRKPGESYLADLVRVFARAARTGESTDKGIGRVVSGLRASVVFDYTVDLRGRDTLLVEEIVATGMHLRIAKDVITRGWNPGVVRTAALVWKAPDPSTRPDYYFIEPGRFVWFQFPWSRLNDYIQFVRVMLQEESRESCKTEWGIEEVERKFREWYGVKPSQPYLQDTLRILEKEGLLRAWEGKQITLSRDFLSC
ncbi:MAG: phosphoribosyltransferase [Zestosphaera sp.]